MEYQDRELISHQTKQWSPYTDSMGTGLEITLL